MKVKGTVVIVCGFLLVSTLLTRSAKLTPEKDSAMAQRASQRLAPGGNQHLSLQDPAANTPLVLEAYGKLPLSFEANQGQTDRQVKFLSRGNGYSLFLTPTATVLALHKPAARNTRHPADAAGVPSEREPERTPPTVLRMRLVGGNAHARLAGMEELPGKSNYFIGNDPKKWRTNVPTYARVKYQSVYPGVDLVYYGNQRQLEHDFIVAPGADPQTITLGFQGADKLRLDAHGDLLIQTGGEEVILRAPVSYQESKGIRQGVPSRYVLKGQQRVGFEVAAYDARKPLIIDPVLVYSTYLGGSNDDRGFGIAVDQHGNAYVTGGTASSNFPTKNPFQGTFGGGLDAFVSKLNEDGSALVYSTYLGGSGSDVGRGITVDQEGNAYVTGFTSSTNFPTKNPFQGTFGGGGDDAFVSKISARR